MSGWVILRLPTSALAGMETVEDPEEDCAAEDEAAVEDMMGVKREKETRSKKFCDQSLTRAAPLRILRHNSKSDCSARGTSGSVY